MDDKVKREGREREERKFATRQEALAGIDSAQDWSQLLERANQALGRDRRDWGDDLAMSAAAALAWRCCAFPIASPPKHAHRNDAGRSQWIDGPLLLRASFGLAKTVAASLLGSFAAEAAPGELRWGKRWSKRAKLGGRRWMACLGRAGRRRSRRGRC